MRYSFDEMLKDLNIGREIEFEYQNRQYAIVNGNGKWLFCEGTKCEELCCFEEKDTLLEKVMSLMVGGASLKEIFDNRLYAQGSLYIL